MIDTGDIDLYLGLDVGKGEHHATALTPAGEKTFDRRLPNSEPKLREVFAKLQAKHGTVLVIVVQVASIGALPLTVARDLDCHVAYLPGLLGDLLGKPVQQQFLHMPRLPQRSRPSTVARCRWFNAASAMNASTGVPCSPAHRTSRSTNSPHAASNSSSAPASHRIRVKSAPPVRSLLA